MKGSPTSNVNEEEGPSAVNTHAYNDAPTRHADPNEFGTAYLHTFNYITSVLIAAGLPARSQADRGPASWPAAEQPGALDPWPQDELAVCIKLGTEGDAQQARRAAELLELLDNYEEARTWWHRAARLGDADAIHYVRIVLAG